MRFTLAGLVVLMLGGVLATDARGQGGVLSPQDFVEIHQLYAAYNYAIDAGDVEAYVALYTPDGSFNQYKGADGLREFMNGREGATRRHWNSNLMLTATPTGARGQVYLLLVDIAAQPPAISLAGRYEDVLVKTPDGWRFRSRQVSADAAPE